jgi:hypothetical protein
MVDALKLHDVVHQREGDTLWWVECSGDRDGDGPTVIARCIHNGDIEDWEVGETCPFSVDPLDYGVEIVGRAVDYDHARAIAELAGPTGFVRGLNKC